MKYISIWFLIMIAFSLLHEGIAKELSEDLPRRWNNFSRKACNENLVDLKKVEKIQYLTIVGVLDGDSLCGEDENKLRYHIRLDGIDAPEYKQSHYKESKRFIAERVLGEKVRMEKQDIDRYKRIIARLYLIDEEGREEFINLTLVQAGWAWVYRYFNKEKPFIEAEEVARKKRVGLWDNLDPQNPYECRRTRKCR